MRKLNGIFACGFFAIVIYVLVGNMIRYSKIAYTLRTAKNSIYIYPMHDLPEDDYFRLIDISNFSFNLVSNACNSSDILLLVVVHSSPNNFAKRKTIRETWGQPSAKIRLVFMMGLVKSKGLQNRLKQESEMYHDITQGNFVDRYNQLTYKHVMSLKYAIYHCFQAKYVLKTDDDVFVNMPNMMLFLREVLSPYGATDLLICQSDIHPKVIRSDGVKWSVSYKEYPKEEYPTYCKGWAILYSPDVLFALYREAPKNKYFWIDDVYVTGILAEKVHVVHTNVWRWPLIMSNRSFYEVTVNGNYVGVSNMFVYGGVNLSEEEIRALWRFVMAKRRTIRNNS